MAKSKQPKPDQVKDHDQKISKASNYLETQKDHKDWYNIHEMGKQRGKPRGTPRDLKKAGGTKKHSLRKEI